MVTLGCFWYCSLHSFLPPLSAVGEEVSCMGLALEGEEDEEEEEEEEEEPPSAHDTPLFC